MGDIKTHPLYLIVFMFVFALVGIGFIYIVHSFIQFAPNPFPQGSQGNAIYLNDTLAKTFYSSGFNILEGGMFFVIITALFINVYYDYHNPSKIRGVMNIFLLFGIGFLWLLLKSGLTQIAFLTTNTGITNVVYSLFVSNYFIMAFAFMMVIGTILCFRTPEGSEDMGGGGAVLGARQDMLGF